MTNLWGFLFFLFLLGFPFFVLVVANKQDGWLKVAGWILSGVFVLILIISSLFSLVTVRDSGPWMFDKTNDFRQHPRFEHQEGFRPDFNGKVFMREWLKDPENRREMMEMLPEFREQIREKIQGYPILPHPEFEGEPFHEPLPFEEKQIVEPPIESETP